MHEEGTPNFRQLCRAYSLNPLQLMKVCDPWIAWAMILDHPMTLGQAFTVLDVFNYLCHTDVGLDGIVWNKQA